MGKIIYFVSYSHKGGFGSCEIVRNNLIRSYADIREIMGVMERVFKSEGVVIINYQRLLKQIKEGAK